MDKADDSGPSESQNSFSLYSMDVMINEPMTRLTLNRLQKSDGLTLNNHSNKRCFKHAQTVLVRYVKNRLIRMINCDSKGFSLNVPRKSILFTSDHQTF